MKLDPIKTGLGNLQKTEAAQKFQPTQTAVPAVQNQPVVESKLSAEFSRADLNDPAKADQMISRAIEEIMGKDFETAGFNKPEQKQMILDWMSNDPSLRSMAVTYLGDVLK